MVDVSVTELWEIFLTERLVLQIFWMNVQGCIIRFKIKCLQSRLPIVQLDKLQLSFGTIYIKKILPIETLFYKW